MTRRPMIWESDTADRFPVGTYARVSEGDSANGFPSLARMVGRVVGTRGTIVAVRFPADVFARAFPFPHSGPWNVPAEFAGANVASFHDDWLFPVRYVSVRFHGPAIARDGSSIGSRYVASGIRGDRMQYTRKADHALTPSENTERAALDYARTRLGMCNPSAEYWRNRNTGAHVFALTDYGTCECSEEYGPCEWHGETMVSREGASVRTADDLGHEFLTDVVSVCRAWPSAEFERETIRLGNALADNESHGCRWLPFDPESSYPDSEALADMIGQAEGFLAGHGYSVYWEDGFRIVRITGGPLAQ